MAGYLTLDDSRFEKGLQGAKKSFTSTGDWIKSNAKKIGLAGGAALGAAVAAGVVANINIGKANDKLAAQLGLTAKESSKAGKIAGSLYRDAYGDSIEGVNTAIGAVMSSIKGMSTASAKDLEKVTAKALDFAASFDVDVTRGVQIAGQMIATGLAKNTTQAFDLITAASQKVPAALREDALDATDEYGQFFASLGYDGQQAMAMIVDASSKGMYGIDKMGDAVKEFTIRSTDMSTLSKTAYEAIGLDAQDMANKILAGGATAQEGTQQVIDGLLGIKDPSMQAQAAIALFGTPLEDLNAAEIPAFLESMRGTSGAMDDVAGASKRAGDTLNDNFATRMEGWKRQLSGFAQDGLMATADGFEDVEVSGKGFFRFMSELGALLRQSTDFIGRNERAFKILGGAVAASLPIFVIYRTIVRAVLAAKVAWTVVTMTATAVQRGWNLAVRLGSAAALGTRIQLGLLAVQTTITSAATRVAASAQRGWASAVALWNRLAIGARLQLAALWVQTAAVATGQLIAAGATRVWTLAQRGLNLALRMNPIGIIITLLVALGAGLVMAYKKSETFRAIVNKAWASIKGGASVAWGAIRPILSALVGFVRDKVPAAFRSGVKAVGSAWDGLKAIAKRPVNFVIDTVYNNGLRAGFNKVAGFLKLKTRLPRMASIGGGGGAAGTGAMSHAPRARNPQAAMGGPGDWLKSVAGKGWDWAQGKMMAPIKAGLAKVGSSPFAQMAKGAGQQTINGAVGWLKDKFAASEHAAFPMGKAGRVLPRGSYSIGMPYLGYPGHYGSDYPAPWGTPVHSPWGGTVARAISMAGSYGKHVFVNHPGGVQTRYAHLSGYNVRAGQAVRAGQQIGQVGSTGNSTGNHLHFEHRKNGRAMNPAGLGIFDTGGLATGAGLMLKGPKPERVLSPRETVAFEELVTAFKSGTGGNSIGGLSDGDIDRLAAALGSMKVDVRLGIDRRTATKIYLGGKAGAGVLP